MIFFYQVLLQLCLNRPNCVINVISFNEQNLQIKFKYNKKQILKKKRRVSTSLKSNQVTQVTLLIYLNKKQIEAK